MAVDLVAIDLVRIDLVKGSCRVKVYSNKCPPWGGGGGFARLTECTC